MTTPEMALAIFEKEVGKLPSNSFADIGNAYLFSNAIEGDFVDDDYIISKKDGSIRPLDFLEYMEIARKIEKPKTYKVQNGTVIAEK